MPELIATRRLNRAHNVRLLELAGFYPATWLPLREHQATLRPTIEITDRLMALGALFAWLGSDETISPTSALEAHVARSSLHLALTAEERQALELPRREARERFGSEADWLVDTMWSLAWILGLDPTPAFDGRAIPAEVRRTVVPFGERGLDATSEAFAARAELRSIADVVMIEDLFYCAHNAARRAVLGEPSARPGFDAIEGENRIRARRHGLTWSLAPGVPWDDIELSS